MYLYVFGFLFLCQSVRSATSSLYRTEYVTGQHIDVKHITDNRSELAPGYLFFAPTRMTLESTQGWGPKIYDVNGLLIWDGRETAYGVAQQFHVCDYEGKIGQHLCWHEASALGIHRKGQSASEIHDFNRVYDNTYTQLGPNYTTSGDLKTSEDWGSKIISATIDQHEFHTVGNGSSYVQTIFLRAHPFDLSVWGGLEDGWILDSCFQEVELITERILFSWCYSDHEPLESHIYPEGPDQEFFSTHMAGDGSWLGAWDFWHINSVDKNEENDYLICGRHDDQIMKIAGEGSPNGLPGAVLWKLGGDSNQFEYEDDFVFSRQHDVRYISTAEVGTVFSIHDNAWEGEGMSQSGSCSSGKIIRINNATMKAKLLREYRHPEGRLSMSGGSMQMLPNNNVLMGWGFIRDITEFSYDGKVLFHAHLEDREQEGTANYRNYKYEWNGLPATDPKLIAYSKFCNRDAALVAYVSWNGATNVTRWRFEVSEFKEGPWLPAGTFNTDGFETEAILSRTFYPHVRVQALDRRGRVLRKSTTATFVPNQDLHGICDRRGCNYPSGDFYLYEARDSSAASCEKRYSLPIIGFVLAVVCIELCSWFYTLILGAGTSHTMSAAHSGVTYKMLVAQRFRDSDQVEAHG